VLHIFAILSFFQRFLNSYVDKVKLTWVKFETYYQCHLCFQISWPTKSRQVCQ